MNNRYPQLPGSERMPGSMISVYAEICYYLVNTSDKTWVFYSEIFEVVADRIPAVTIKNLLREMEHAGVIRRQKNGTHRFSSYDKLYLTHTGRHWLTCYS